VKEILPLRAGARDGASKAAYMAHGKQECALAYWFCVLRFFLFAAL
jgi:hypothetical protein